MITNHRLHNVLAIYACLTFVNCGRTDGQQRSSQDAGTAYAFLVAISGYDKNELDTLPYTVLEMEEFRDVLEASGYDPANIKLMSDKAERRYLPERKKVVDELQLLLARLSEKDSILVALNGHGLHFVGDKSGYFCPIDAQVEDRTTMIPIDTDQNGQPGFFPMLQKCKAQRKLLLVNACRNDPLSNRAQASERIRLDDLETEPVPAGIAMLSSCSPGDKSYYYDPDDERTKGRQRSLFFHHVIETWQSRGSNVTIDDLFTNVVSKVSADADNIFGKRQIPLKRREYQGEGEWYLRGNTTRVEPLAPRFPYSAAQAKQYQAAYANFIGKPVEVTNQIGMDMVLVPPGIFTMGSPTTELARQDDEASHQVTLTQGFYLGKYEVTQAEFEQVMGYNPSRFGTDVVTPSDGLPVESISWFDAVEFCNKLSLSEGRTPAYTLTGIEREDNGQNIKSAKVRPRAGNGYRLPTEAEWEYAARSGTNTPFHFGANITTDQVNYDGNFPYASAAEGEYRESTVPAKLFLPNGFGLHQIHGNVWEWCLDAYSDSLPGGVDPYGIESGKFGTKEVGGWENTGYSFCASRGWISPEHRDGTLGFRIALVQDARLPILGITRTSDRKFILHADGSIRENGQPVLQAGEGFAAKITATDDWLYALSN